MSDSYVPDQSESLDGDELGEDIGGEHLPGIGDYPPEESLGVEDPSLAGPDDVATRELRRDVDEAVSDEDRPVDLADPEDTLGVGGEDVEQEALGDAFEPEPGDPVEPEVAAMHVVDEP
jgi:hypothetical protein